MRRGLIGLLALLSAAVVALAGAPSRAASYPDRLVKLVVPFPAGGPTDGAARLIAQALSSRLRPPPGGGEPRRARGGGWAPDAYTLLLGGTNVNAIIGALYKDIGFDPIASFAPIAAICTDTMALAISPTPPPQAFPAVVPSSKD